MNYGMLDDVTDRKAALSIYWPIDEDTPIDGGDIVVFADGQAFEWTSDHLPKCPKHLSSWAQNIGDAIYMSGNLIGREVPVVVVLREFRMLMDEDIVRDGDLIIHSQLEDLHGQEDYQIFGGKEVSTIHKHFPDVQFLRSIWDWR